MQCKEASKYWRFKLCINHILTIRWEKRLRQELNAMAAELVSDSLFVQWLCITLWAGPSAVAFKAQRGRQRQQHALCDSLFGEKDPDANNEFTPQKNRGQCSVVRKCEVC